MVKIIADSTCDLSPELIERYGVDILPLHIILGDQDFEDGRSITPDDIYRWSDENRSTPKTAACSQADAEEKLARYLAQGHEVVCLAISESMSSTANAMRLAAEKLGAGDRVKVIDSANLSTGMGMLVIAASLMASQGATAAQIAACVEEIKPHVRASFVVDTLTYLHRGGRCSGAAALVGGTLQLHPKIVVENGRMSPAKKYRGRMSRTILAYAKDMESDLRTAVKDRVFITHSGCKEEDIEAVRQYLESLNHFDEILITRAGGVISSHCGPGTLGVLYISGN